MEVFGLELIAGCIVMMERPYMDFKSKEVQE
jgi:hypothetical protein